MRLMTDLQADLLSAVLAEDPEPLTIISELLSTARQLERRGFVQVGRTDRKGDNGGRLYEVSLTTAGRAHARSR